MPDEIKPEIVAEVPEGAIVESVEAEAPAAEEAPKKATRSRKKVDLDAELAKQHGTFAVGIQAAIRDLMRLKK